MFVLENKPVMTFVLELIKHDFFILVEQNRLFKIRLLVKKLFLLWTKNGN
jgi:hypothetical protein